MGVGGGWRQDKPAWTACPPGVKITRVVGVRYQVGGGGGAICLGGKINWDTGWKQRITFFCPLATVTFENELQQWVF